MIHGALIPQWTVPQVLKLSREVESALTNDARSLFDQMYGNQPDEWDESLKGMDRLRFVINVLTRVRVCTAEGKIDVKMKGGPGKARPPFQPWFEFENRRTRDARVIFGHWSALGFHKAHGVVALDTGCVWGGALTAYDLDSEREPISLDCKGYQPVGE
jgi:bis(5'-nucleosyl)-tetraphosphatase (symmetrical)